MKIIEATASLKAELPQVGAYGVPLPGFTVGLTLRAVTTQDENPEDIFAAVHSLQMQAESLVTDEIREIRRKLEAMAI